MLPPPFFTLGSTFLSLKAVFDLRHEAWIVLTEYLHLGLVSSQRIVKQFLRLLQHFIGEWHAGFSMSFHQRFLSGNTAVKSAPLSV